MAITPSRSRAVFREYACYCWLCWCFSIHRSTLIMMIDSPHATITVWDLEKLSRSSRQTDRQDIDNGFAIHSCSGLVRAVHNTTLRCCWAFLLDGSLSAVCRPAGTNKLQADLPRGQRKAHRPVAEARRRSERVLPAVAVCGMAVGGSTR